MRCHEKEEKEWEMLREDMPDEQGRNQNRWTGTVNFHSPIERYEGKNSVDVD